MINLKDDKYQDKSVKIFNGGRAGIVKGCTTRIERKTKEDADNAPLYKLYIVDSAGGEMNKGYFLPKEDASDKAKDFFVREMNHLVKVFRATVKDEYDSYKDLLDTVMKACKDKQSNIMVNAAVCYGSQDYPRRYLELDGFWGLMNEEDGVPRLSPNALLERPEDESQQPLKVTTTTAGSEDVEEEW